MVCESGEKREFQTSGQDAKAAEVTPLLWGEPKLDLA